MPFDYQDVEQHKKYLAAVPRDVVQRRLEFFRLKEDVMNDLPLNCIDDTISDKYAIWNKWVHPLDPISLDDLKNWFGTPNEVARKQLNATSMLLEGGRLWGRLDRVSVRDLPMRRNYDFRELDPEQRIAVKQMANNLFYGYVDPEEAAKPPISGVIDYMIERTKAVNPKIFVAPDLIVCPDKSVTFQNFPALLFNNVLVYGNGQIITKSHTKIDAFQIQHIDV